MVHARLVANEATKAIFNLAIGPRQTVMLAKVFRPRTHDERLDVTVWSFEIPANNPIVTLHRDAGCVRIRVSSR